jgi:hypothetical protein
MTSLTVSLATSSHSSQPRRPVVPLYSIIQRWRYMFANAHTIYIEEDKQGGPLNHPDPTDAYNDEGEEWESRNRSTMCSYADVGAHQTRHCIPFVWCLTAIRTGTVPWPHSGSTTWRHCIIFLRLWSWLSINIEKSLKIQKQLNLTTCGWHSVSP